jgi:hypothetical protein
MAANVEQSPNHQFKAKVFISYSRKDMPFADRLDAALRARDFEPLIDRTEIYAFEDWWQRIETLIGRADTIVFETRQVPQITAESQREGHAILACLRWLAIAQKTIAPFFPGFLTFLG